MKNLPIMSPTKLIFTEIIGCVVKLLAIAVVGSIAAWIAFELAILMLQTLFCMNVND